MDHQLEKVKYLGPLLSFSHPVGRFVTTSPRESWAKIVEGPFLMFACCASPFFRISSSAPGRWGSSYEPIKEGRLAFLQSLGMRPKRD